jgi:hypothetical protein
MKENDLKDRERRFLDKFISKLKLEYGLSEDEILSILNQIEDSIVKEEVAIPITIYDNKELSILETSCKYLKEELNLNYHQIAELLNRDDRTIWTTYNNASKKRKERLWSKETRIFVPSSVFKDRKLGVLESIVLYLKDKIGLRYSEIGILLNRDERNIWTVYNRAVKKTV